MSDDLRDRIANTLYQELSIELPAAIRGADAVIREIGGFVNENGVWGVIDFLIEIAGPRCFAEGEFDTNPKGFVYDDKLYEKEAELAREMDRLQRAHWQAFIAAEYDKAVRECGPVVANLLFPTTAPPKDDR